MAQMYNSTGLANKCMEVMLDNYAKIRDEHFPAHKRVAAPQGDGAVADVASSSSSSSGERNELDEVTAERLEASWDERNRRYARKGKFLFVPHW
jgi:hypothetical protein